VLTDDNDPCSHWAAAELAQRGLAPIEVVTATELATSPRVALTIAADGVTAVAIQLRDGRSLDSRQTRGVLNRLTALPPSVTDRLRIDDREYGLNEQYAFVLGWLQSFGRRVINPAQPRGLSGELRSFSEWCALASRAGLPIADFRSDGPWGRYAPDGEWREAGGPFGTSSRTLLVADDTILGPATAQERVACRHLSHLAACPLLEITIFEGRDGGRALFGRASTRPDLRAYGAAAIDALVPAFLSRCAGAP
jgi:hypothetical protein